MASSLGMVRVAGKLCRNKKGHFATCRGKVSKGKGTGYGKKHAARKGKSSGLKGRCLRWSKATGNRKRRCLKREHGRGRR